MSKQHAKPVITDSRFAAVHTDPRFQRFPKFKRTVQVDERFSGMFNDPEFQASAVVDKRGRKLAHKRKGDDLKKYYHLKDEEEWRAEAPKPEAVPAVAEQEQARENAAKSSKRLDTAASKLHRTGGESKRTSQDVAEAAMTQPAVQRVGKKDADGGRKPSAAPRASKQAKPADVEPDAQTAGPSKSGRQGGKLGVAPAASMQAAPAEANGNGRVAGRAVKGQTARGHGTSRPGQASIKAADSEDDSEGPSGGDRELQGSGSEGGHEGKDGGATNSSDGGDSSDEEDGDDEFQKRWARARGLADVSSSEDDSQDESEELDSADEELSEDDEEDDDATAAEAQWGVGAYALNPAEPIPKGDETRRLAVVDLDWERIRAVDILAALNSFLPRGGEISRVTVYPSDYGLQRIAEEATRGPQGIFSKEDSDDDDEEEEGDDDEAGPTQARKKKSKEGDGEDGGDLDPEQLRMYEQSKLRWYYAIVECDTVATALQLYNECDGMELELSACKFDLRFVPDEQDFSQRQVRESATAVPADYTAPQFASALQFTQPKLTWDAEDEGRKKVLTRKITDADAIKDDDFAAYLGSDADEEEADDAGDAEAIRQRYRALLLSGGDKAEGDKKGGKAWENGGDESSGSEEEAGASRGIKARVQDKTGMEMEVTFTPGLEGLGERLLAKKREAKDREGETVWEAYLRRRAEKKRAARAQGRRHGGSSSDSGDDDDDLLAARDAGSDGEEGEDDPFFQHDDDAFNDPFFKGGDDAGADVPEGSGITAAANGADNKAKKDKKDKARKGKDKEERRKQREEEAKQQAELELLLMDDTQLQLSARGRGGKASTSGQAAAAGGAVAQQQPKKLSKKERQLLRKEQKRALQRCGSDDEEQLEIDGFQPDLTDPRFAAMLTSHDFALDPTDPTFQRMKAPAKLAGKQPKQQRREQSSQVPAEPPEPKSSSHAANGNGVVRPDAASKLELRAMVAKLKRKAEVQGSASTTATAKKQKPGRS